MHRSFLTTFKKLCYKRAVIEEKEMEGDVCFALPDF